MSPQRCTYFLAGPVTREWHLEALQHVGQQINLAIPIGCGDDGVHDDTKYYNHQHPAEFGAAEIVAAHGRTIRACCGVLAMIDHGDRVGTVVDVLSAVNAGRPVVLLDRTSGSTGCGDEYPCSHGCTRGPSPAWYLFGALQPRVDKGLAHIIGAEDGWSAARAVVSTYAGRCALRHIPTSGVEYESQAHGMDTVGVRPERKS